MVRDSLTLSFIKWVVSLVYIRGSGKADESLWKMTRGKSNGGFEG